MAPLVWLVGLIWLLIISLWVLDMPTGPRVSKHQAIIHGPTPGQKLLHEGGPVYLVFDLNNDPGELNDLSRSRPVVAEMFEAYQEKLATLHEVRVDPTL